MDKIIIDHFYIKGRRLYAVEDVQAQARGLDVMLRQKPRVFSLGGEDEHEIYVKINVEEVDALLDNQKGG